LTARLKPCPFKAASFSAACKAVPFKTQFFRQSVEAKTHLRRQALGMQVGGFQHLKELAAGALVDGYGQQLAVAAEEKGVRNSVDVELFVDLAIAIEQYGRLIVGGRNVLAHLERLFVGDGENDQALRLKVAIEKVEIAHLQPTR